MTSRRRALAALVVLPIFATSATHAADGATAARSGGRAPAALVGVEEGTLGRTAPSADAQVGTSLALSPDGSVALVGGVDPSASGGMALRFERIGATWSGGVAIPVTPDRNTDRFGCAVALSADGALAIVGASSEDMLASDGGAVHVATWAGTAWGPSRRVGPAFGVLGSGAEYGTSVAVASDGSRFVGGAPGERAGSVRPGAAYVFRMGATDWELEATLSGAADGERAGLAVAMSALGDRIVVGAPLATSPDGAGAGRARVYLRAGTAWTLEAVLEGGGSAGDALGGSVALSPDGSIALVGALTTDVGAAVNAGEARVFVRTGTTWTRGPSLRAATPAADDAFGGSVALGAGGTLALIGAPLDDTTAGADAGSASLFVRTGTTWARVSELAASGAAAGDRFGASVALAEDGLRAIVGAPLDDRALADDGTARVFALRRTDGEPCTVAAGCVSGACVDGVCCATSCAGGTSDCQACSIAAGGTVDGTCTALSTTAAPTVTCRPAAGPPPLGGSGVAAITCDVPEVCSPGSTSCPTDLFLVAGTACRGLGSGGCDAAEECTGASGICPTDAVAVAGTICRASAGACDVEELCGGASFDCPPDLRLSSGTSCRAPNGACDVGEACDGSAACPADAFRPAGTVCLTASGDCDVDDVCSGSSGDCPTLVASSGTACRAAGAEPCDAPDTCDGASTACPDLFLSGVECRPSAGGCDGAEACSGSSAACPPDLVEAAGMVCRAATAACDTAEECDGVSSSCPADVTACTSDAGADAGPGRDAAPVDAPVPADAAAPPAVASGCGCRAASRSPQGLALALGLVGALLRRGRARTASGEVVRKELESA